MSNNVINVYYAGEETSPVYERLELFFSEREDASFNLSKLKSSNINLSKLDYKDIVVLNLDLNTLDEIEALKTIKRKLIVAKPTLIAVTNTIDHNTVSTAAEIGVDGFLVKPFNSYMFHNVIDSIKDFTYAPTEYFKIIETGKFHLFKKSDYDTSYNIFMKAIEYNSAPTLAYYYLGKTCEFLDKDVSAINHYRRGLKLNKWHIKSLIALYNTYMRHSDISEAFELLKHIASIFPESPDRFCDLVKLAVKNYRFREIPDLCTHYESVRFSNDKMDKYFFSALYISTKHFLSKRKPIEAGTVAMALMNFSNKDNYYYNLLKQAYREFDYLSMFQERFGNITPRISA